LCFRALFEHSEDGFEHFVPLLVLLEVCYVVSHNLDLQWDVFGLDRHFKHFV